MSRRVYILTEKDFEALVESIKRDPDHGESGSSSQHKSDQERGYYREAHRFYNHRVHTWINEMKS